MKNHCLTLFLSCLLITTVQAQNQFYCGTPPMNPEIIRQIQELAAASVSPRSNNTRYIPVSIHIIGEDNGAGYYSYENVLDKFCELNAVFEHANIQFYLAGDPNYINNSNWYAIDVNTNPWDTAQHVGQIHNIDSTYNCYINESLAFNLGMASLTFFDGQGAESVWLTQIGLNTLRTLWAHEFGHAFTLLHTFWGWHCIDPDLSAPAPETTLECNGLEYKVEKADGSNCSQSGDFICDTPADYLNGNFYNWDCDEEGMSLIEQIDPDGNVFRSDGTLIMSYADDDCTTRFSPMQIERMHWGITSYGQHLLQDQTPPVEIQDSEIMTLSPFPGETVMNNTPVTLEWEAVSGASHYLVKYWWILVNGNPAQIKVESVDTTSITLDLLPNREYRWQVKPYNAHLTCRDLSEDHQFFTGEVTQAEEITGIDRFVLAPNLVRAGQELSLQIDAQKGMNINVSLINISGQVVNTLGDFSLETGNNLLHLSLGEQSGGIYWLFVQTPEGRWSRKFVVVN